MSGKNSVLDSQRAKIKKITDQTNIRLVFTLLENTFETL